MLRFPLKRSSDVRLQTLGAVIGLGIAALVAGCDGGACEGDCACSGAECVCPSSGDCLIDCAGGCDLQCAGSGDCDFVCGAGCVADCTGSGACVLDVGAGSSVACTGSGGCDVACHGDCEVSCPGSGECIVRCDPGAECVLDRCESPVTCPDGVVVCHGACPG
jgi:hypothetical protein